MIFIKNNITDVYFNLSMEEYIFEKFKDDDIFIFWINEPSVVIGKHQNLIEEVNMRYCFENKIKIARRISGGGTVFHDFGNLNYTYITNTTGHTELNFKEFLKPMYNSLINLGINVIVSDRNDFRVDNKKICGHSEFMRKKRVLHHGCILFNSNLKKLKESLNVKDKKVISNSAKSVRSSVANLKEISNLDYDISDFIQKLEHEILKLSNDIYIYSLTEDDILNINKIKEEKYETKEWIYGQSPKCIYLLDEEKNYNVEIINGKIEKLNIGNTIFNQFNGIYFEYEDIKNKIEELKIENENILKLKRI